MEGEVCGICGGDGRVANAFGGSTATCPGCHGTGRKTDVSQVFRDVTKTKPSHHKAPASGPAAAKWPTSLEGTQLANAIRDGSLGADVKTRLIVEIIDHEATHGRCTQTFVKKMRKQAGIAAPTPK